MFVIGFSCHVNTSVALGFTAYLAKDHGLIARWGLFSVMLRALFFCSRALNAYFLLVMPHRERLSFMIFFWYTAYPLLIVAYFFRDNERAVGIATVSCVI